MGAQIGQVLGFLAQRVLGQYDVAVPRSGPGAVLFVVPNIRRSRPTGRWTRPTFARSWRSAR